MTFDLDSKELYKKIGEKIEYTRLIKKKTVKEMAFFLGLTQSAYRNIERGITALSIFKLFQIALLIHERPVDLLDLTDKNATDENLSTQSKSQMEFYYQVRIQQYKDEIISLKKQLELLQTLILKRSTV